MTTTPDEVLRQADESFWACIARGDTSWRQAWSEAAKVLAEHVRDEERATIVAWLRSDVGQGYYDSDINSIARDIEAGEHRR